MPWSRAKAIYWRSRTLESWLRLKGKVRSSLEIAQCLQAGAGSHKIYLNKLRMGVRMSATLDQSDVLQKQKRKSIQRQITTKGVVTEVTDEKQAAELEMWQQGDVTMYEDAAIEKRLKLRHDPRVRESLEAWWQALLQAPCADSEDDELVQGASEAFVDFAQYSTMMRRVYRVMLARFDEADAKNQIASDWEEDAKGKSRLSRKLFCDALFQLADLWTAGICSYEYTAFLKTLLHKVVDIGMVTGDDGIEVTNHVWKEEAHCVHDADMFPDIPEPSGTDLNATSDAKSAAGGSAGDAGGSGAGGSSYRDQARKVVQHANETKTSATLIQKHYRRKKARRSTDHRQRAVRTVQSGARGYQQRRAKLRSTDHGAATKRNHDTEPAEPADLKSSSDTAVTRTMHGAEKAQDLEHASHSTMAIHPRSPEQQGPHHLRSTLHTGYLDFLPSQIRTRTSMDGAQSGSQMGTESTSQWETQPGVQASGALLGTQSGSPWEAHSGSQWGTQPGSQWGTQSGSQLGVQSGVQLAAQSGAQSARTPWLSPLHKPNVALIARYSKHDSPLLSPRWLPVRLDSRNGVRALPQRHLPQNMAAAVYGGHAAYLYHGTPRVLYDVQAPSRQPQRSLRPLRPHYQSTASSGGHMTSAPLNASPGALTPWAIHVARQQLIGRPCPLQKPQGLPPLTSLSSRV